MSLETEKFKLGFYEVLRGQINKIECPQNCDTKKIVVQLKEDGQELFVYCNTCGTIIFDSKKEIERLCLNSQ